MDTETGLPPVSFNIVTGDEVKDILFPKKELLKPGKYDAAVLFAERCTNKDNTGWYVAVCFFIEGREIIRRFSIGCSNKSVNERETAILSSLFAALGYTGHIPNLDSFLSEKITAYAERGNPLRLVVQVTIKKANTGKKDGKLYPESNSVEGFYPRGTPVGHTGTTATPDTDIPF